jgi:4'-phosphopantetheinyl transferase
MTPPAGVDVAWLAAEFADVPADDAWLHPAEAAVLAGLSIAPRRRAWRLGRWTAKQAVRAWHGDPLGAPSDLAVLAADDGAPEAHADGARAVSVSISHRAGRAAVAVAAAPTVVGCDLEVVEPRSPAFVREWLTPEERATVAELTPDERPCWVNLVWTAKEAAAKVLREGLRLDTRELAVRLGPAPRRLPPPGRWHPLRVEVRGRAEPITGWCRADAPWVVSIAADPAPAVPRWLGA